MEIVVLGAFEVRTEQGRVAEVPGARLRGLLVALALRPGQVVSKAALVDWIWGEDPPLEVANALQRLVSRLRKALPGSVIQGETDGYRLAVRPEAVDAVRFEQLVAESRSRGTDVVVLREALGLWRGAAMEDVGLRDSATFDAAVGRLEELRLSATEEWASAEIAVGRGPEIVARLSDLLAANPLREPLAVALMQALASAGRANEALLVFQRTRKVLAEALGADPGPALTELHLSLLRGVRVARTEPGRRTGNLRAELTSFVGRSTDVAQVGNLLNEGRLVTLIGPGGSGKTRLAGESARLLASPPSGGIWLVELAAIGTGVAQAALAALGPREALLGTGPEIPSLERVVAAIGDRETLLILDNCEHVIEQAAAFAHEVLGACPNLRILATSREPLGITGEVLWPVLPLPVPGESADLAEIGASPAVRLLAERARAGRPELVLDDPLMAQVCRALDGMPLAIELAAARLRTMTLEQLAHRLNDRFRLLTGGSRTALPRHRTLQAVIDWSWQLLSDDERLVLRRLSVFSGGCGLEAAEFVCGRDDLPELLDLLTSLAEKSLLVTEGAGAPRYRLLGTIREYAALQLAEADETDAMRRAHLAYFTEFAQTAEPHLRRREQLEWLEVLGVEHDNISAAMRWALGAQDVPGAMRLAAAAGWYWWLSGHKAEGSELVTAALALAGEADDESTAMVYALMVMFLNSGRGDERDAAEWIHKAYQLSLRLGPGNPILGLVTPLERMLHDPAAYLDAFEPLLDSEDPWVRALARLHLGKVRVVLGHSGTEADVYLQTALAEFRSLGERFGISFAHTELAARTAMRGDLAAACEHYEQAITAVTEIGAVEDVIALRARQAQLFWLTGDAAAGNVALAEAQRHAERVTWSAALLELALVKADLARRRGDAAGARQQLELAAQMLGAEAERADFRAQKHDLLGYLAEDVAQAHRHRVEALRAASETGFGLAIAQVLVGVADLALRLDQGLLAAKLLAASTALRGLPDLGPDAARVRLGAGFDEVLPEGEHWSELAEAVFAVRV